MSRTVMDSLSAPMRSASAVWISTVLVSAISMLRARTVVLARLIRCIRWNHSNGTSPSAMLCAVTAR
ncbi:hypothetical protein [Nocardia wallacei]|uniref:hypothetical protein n=1 Tax=Nocardia wallacei TaxID=480035 RepID=UPI00245665E7|nr:hypothetical protein [Nocardia wallacei]